MMNEEDKMFDPKAFTEESKRTRTLEDEEGEIRYTIFTLGDAIELSKVADPSERALHIVFSMLKNAYPGLKIEDIKAWPPVRFGRILEKLAKVAGLAPANPGE